MAFNQEFNYEEIVGRHKGLIQMNIKVSIRDSEALSLVYTPGVATPCLEIQKDQDKAYEQTNKGNSILIITDSSGAGEGWTNDANMPYLEAFCAYYKQIANIDALPIIVDMALIPDAETLLDTCTHITKTVHGFELFNVSPSRAKKVYELVEMGDWEEKIAILDGTKKKEIDELLKTKNTHMNSSAVVAAIWRVVLDYHVFGGVNNILDHVLEMIKTDKINIKDKNPFDIDFIACIREASNFVMDKQLFAPHLEKYNWKKSKYSKDYSLRKYKEFITFGYKAWVEDMPKGYYMHKHTNKENAELVHQRNRGVVDVGLKINITSRSILKDLYDWKNLDKIAQRILKNHDDVYEYTCKHNFGAIVTNGTI